MFLGLTFRNYFLSPKLNHGFSGENTTFLKINYKCTHHTKYLHLEENIFSTCNSNKIDLVKHKISLEHNFQSNHFSQPNQDNEFTFCLIKVALSLVLGLKQFTKTRTKLFAFFLLSQCSISCFLLKTLNQNELQKVLKKYSKGEFFTIESLKINENIFTIKQEMNLNLVTLREMNYKDHTKFFRLILLLSGDINLNPGPTQISETWSVFKKRGLHFVHLNINSLPSKIEELRQITKNTNSAVIGLSETKLDKTIFDFEVSIPNYSLVRKERNRKGGGVACYIRSDICFNSQNYLSDDIENISFLLPKTKPISIAIVCKPPTNNRFLDYLSKGLNDFNLMENDLFIFGDTNINILDNGENILDKCKDMSKRKSNLGVIPKKYAQICSALGLKQLIKHPTRITCHTSTLIDHIITNCEEKVTQGGVINTSLSDYQLIFCTRKIKRVKTKNHKPISFRSLKNYSIENFEQELKNFVFPNYKKFSDVNSARSDLVNKITQVLNNLAPYKTIRVKNQSNEWFDGELAEQISNRDKLFKKFKKSKLHIDELIYKEAKNTVQGLIKEKKKHFFSKKLEENIGGPKELWKNLRKLGLPKTKTPSSNICLKENDGLSFCSLSIANNFSLSNLTQNLIEKFPTGPSKFDINSVREFYKPRNLKEDPFHFPKVSEKTISDFLKELKTNKATGIDNLSDRFLKDGPKVFATPLAQIYYLSIKLSTVPDECKIAKLKPIYKKGKKTDPKNYRPISFLPVISKILEKAIHDQTMDFVTKKNILYKFQSSFRKFHSTDSCLSHLQDKASKEFDSGLLTGMILIDL